MQRVDPSLGDGTAGRHQRLSGDLATEDPLPRFVGTPAAEDVDLDLFQVEQRDEGIQLGRHRSILSPARGCLVLETTTR